MLNGSAYRHPGVPQKTTLCSDYFKRDRKFSDLVESSNHAIGADTHRKLLVSGCMNGASMLTSLLHSEDPLLCRMYEDIASHLCSGLTLSLLHLRNSPIAFTGSLEYFDLNPTGGEAPRLSPEVGSQGA
jgi:hypothetical protein